MSGENMKKDKTLDLTKEALALQKMPDTEIDCQDIPEVTGFDLNDRGRFYRPIKQAVTLRLDADVVAWFKQHHPKYQTAINNALREFVFGPSRDKKQHQVLA